MKILDLLKGDKCLVEGEQLWWDKQIKHPQYSTEF
jgi:hypothetical protein